MKYPLWSSVQKSETIEMILIIFRYSNFVSFFSSVTKECSEFNNLSLAFINVISIINTIINDTNEIS